jgi:hypothetical protein
MRRERCMHFLILTENIDSPTYRRHVHAMDIVGSLALLVHVVVCGGGLSCHLFSVDKTKSSS